MISYLFYSLFLGGFVYPVVVHFIWSGNGFLSAGISNPLLGAGVIDFAGSGVVHLTGGTAALCASYITGPRNGRFYNLRGEPLKRPGLRQGHSVALQLLGTMILWFGWYGFNPGSALLLSVQNKGEIATRVAVTTTLAAATSAITALITHGWYLQYTEGDFHLDITKAMNGCLAGLVAITGPCGTVTEGWAIVIGVFSAWFYLASTSLLILWKIDDAVDAIPVHFTNGIWGMIAVGLFSDPRLVERAFEIEGRQGWFYDMSSPHLLVNQLVGTLFIISWTCITMLPFFKGLDYFGCLRVHVIDEIVGLDARYTGKEIPNKLYDEDSDETDEELRLRAYRMRFEGKRNKVPVAMENLIEASWGDIGSATAGGAPLTDGVAEGDSKFNQKQGGAPKEPEAVDKLPTPVMTTVDASVDSRRRDEVQC